MWLSLASAAGFLVPLPSSAAACSDTPTFDPAITSPSAAIPGWPQRRATTQELIDYFHQVDGESTLVRVGNFAHAWSGTPLVYALVSNPGHMQHPRAIARDEKLLADPRRTRSERANRLAVSSPGIVWYGGGPHGNEPSGGDASMQILYELAARTDCATARIRDQLLVGIMATQNPDGRTNVSRTNGYGFDLNRDWFARTQPETDGKLKILMRYPPLVFIDPHEDAGNGGARFWFPPDADPIFHEVSHQSIHWINDLYGQALAAAFDERNQQNPATFTHASYAPYDLLYLGYGDSVPTTAFTAAGMTFEKSAADTDEQRELEQYVAGWTTIATAAEHKTEILKDYYRAHVQAVAQGRAGTLQPNLVQQPGSKIERQVPKQRIRGYFLYDDRADTEVAHELDRLIRLGVEIYRTKRPLVVPDLRPYGGRPHRVVVPGGTFWIPMDQPQKHWVEGMLGQDPYVPFPYFYDVTAWSNPLLMDLHAGSSAAFTRSDCAGKPSEVAICRRISHAPRGEILGRVHGPGFFQFAGDTGKAVAAALSLARSGLRVRRGGISPVLGCRGGDMCSYPPIPSAFVVAKNPRSTSAVRRTATRFQLRVDVIRGLGAPREGTLLKQPKIAVYASQAGGESYDHLRFLLDKVWHVPWTPMSGAAVATGGLTGYDVFIVPGVDTSDLSPSASTIADWISAGGTYVGTARPGGTGGTPFAVQNGLTTSTETTATGLQVPGTLFHVRLNHASPITLGAPRDAYWYHLGEDVLSPSTTGVNGGVFPRKPPTFWFSGYAEGEQALRGSAGLVDETSGDGHVILFSGEPNFRAFTEGTQFLLANALIYPKGTHTSSTDVRSPVARAAVRTAMASWHPPFGPGRPLRIEVALGDVATARSVLRGLGAADIRTARAGGSAFLTIPNPDDLDVEQHPFAGQIIPALRRAGVAVRSAIL
jgi:hypothetical protein